MLPLPRAQRFQRSHQWLWMYVRYAYRIWQVRRVPPGVRISRIPKLAEQHVHNWIWGYIDADDVYLPRKH